MPQHRSRPFSLRARLEDLVGAGLYLLLLGLLLEALTLTLRQHMSVPISLTFGAQVLLTLPCVAGCLGGAIWFHRSLNLAEVHLRKGHRELVTHGPFAYVRHPLYSTLLMTIPPLAVVWLSDLVFLVPWGLLIVLSHQVVRLEERRLIQAFGRDYERYRRCVPALLPYRGTGGRRYREGGVDSAPEPLR